MAGDLRAGLTRKQEGRRERQQHEQERARDLVSGDGMQRFEFGLDMLIDGLARYVER